jgi:hypothetical protein
MLIVFSFSDKEPAQLYECLKLCGIIMKKISVKGGKLFRQIKDLDQ